MNTANLQIEGILAAVSALVVALRQKGLLSEAEVEAALAGAEATVVADAKRPAEISPANVAAIAFPLRYLRHVNSLNCDSEAPSFSAVAAEIGRRKSNGVLDKDAGTA